MYQIYIICFISSIISSPSFILYLSLPPYFPSLPISFYLSFHSLHISIYNSPLFFSFTSLPISLLLSPSFTPTPSRFFSLSFPILTISLLLSPLHSLSLSSLSSTLSFSLSLSLSIYFTSRYLSPSFIYLLSLSLSLSLFLFLSLLVLTSSFILSSCFNVGEWSVSANVLPSTAQSGKLRLQLKPAR